jgi:hypothetical protein
MIVLGEVLLDYAPAGQELVNELGYFGRAWKVALDHVPTEVLFWI